ncbi:MAG TPA: zinc ribbon domain-containing protein [Roseiflexaceae bacterium]|nr:zinc ribbon domain-containing protein [Roseiflexaceae bacterium]
MSISTCPQCGAPLSLAATFCPACGVALSSAGQPTQALPPEDAPHASRTRPGTLPEIIERYSAFLKDGAIFLAPDIPPAKRDNAVQTYATTAPDETIWLLVDDSIFGSAKDGLVLTEHHLYARRDFFTPPVRFPLVQINSVQVREDTGSLAVYINDVHCCYIHPSEQRNAYLLGELLLEVVAAVRPPSSPPVQAEVLRALNVLFLAGLLTKDELETKRASYLART